MAQDSIIRNKDKNMAEHPHIIIIRLAGEVATKGPRAQKHFVKLLETNISAALDKDDIGHHFSHPHNQIFLHCDDMQGALNILPRIFGIGSFSPIDLIAEATNIDGIIDLALPLFESHIAGKTFCVRSKRMGKHPISCSDLNIRLGGALNQHVESATVKLKEPEVQILIQLTNDQHIYFCHRRIKGAGGLPINPKNRCICLISGGFDSAVAAWQLMRRGIAVDYAFCNMAGSANERMVLQVAKVITELWGHGYAPKFYAVPFDDIITELQTKCGETYRQIVLKRMMYRIANALGRMYRYEAIITGEAIGQVASQTVRNLSLIEKISDFIVLRPLIGMEKMDIVDQARYIGTAVLSEKIKEYCGISKGHPVVRGKLDRMDEEDAKCDLEIITRAIDAMKVIDLNDVTAKDLRSDYLFADDIDEEAILIDCQPANFYAKWHVPGAINIPTDDLMKGYKKLDKDKKYILYCSWGTQTPYAAELMQQAGYEAYAFRGGLSKLQQYFSDLGLDLT